MNTGWVELEASGWDDEGEEPDLEIVLADDGQVRITGNVQGDPDNKDRWHWFIDRESTDPAEGFTTIIQGYASKQDAIQAIEGWASL